MTVERTTLGQRKGRRRSAILWAAPMQAASLFTVWAIAAGGQTLRAWLLSALLWLLTLPLLVSLEASLLAMMLFEPFRGLLRRAQYLFIEYGAQDPIHVVTPIVTVLAMALLLKGTGLRMFRLTRLAGSVSVLALIYFLEIFNPLQGGIAIGLAGTLFLLVPVAWFFFGQSMKPEYMNTALRLMIIVGLITSAYGVYQLVFGYPGFEQYWIDNTDYYESIAVGHVNRALATFSSAEEWGRYTEIGAIAAFGFAAGAKRLRNKIGWVLTALGLCGAILLTGQRTAVFGLIVGITVLIMLGARNAKALVARLALLLIPVVAVVAFAKAPTADDMWSKDNDQTVSTLLSHTTRGTLNPAEEESFQIRLENWTNLITQVIPYRPLGAGLGAGSLSEVRFTQAAELPAIDSFILVVAVACGIPGALLFIWILSRATWLSWRVARWAQGDDLMAPTKRIVAAIMCALVLNSIFGLTFTIYSVAPVAWMMIGWISAQASNPEASEEREVLTL